MSQSTKVLKEFGAVTSFGGSVDKISGTGALGAINLSTSVTVVGTTGAATATLADGFEGQIKTIICGAYAADLVLTPANLAGSPTTITFNAAGDSVVLLFVSGNWFSVGTATAVLA